MLHEQPGAGSAADRGRRPRWLRWLRWLAVVALAVLAATTSVAAFGTSSQALGPLQSEVGLTVSPAGGTRVEVPPLGAVSLATHRGPLQVRATVVEVRADQARRLVSRDARSRALEDLAAQARGAAVRAALVSAAVALLGAALACAAVFRRWRETLAGGLVVLALLAVGGGVAAATWRPEALSEPRFTGTLARAPGLVGAARDFDAYSERVAELALNVSRLYGTVASLPSPPDADAVRVLWVSDIHNNPQAFDVMAEVVQQFRVQAVFDTGDLTDLGSAVETQQLARVSSFGVPYVYVRGNHDSESVTQAYLEGRPQVVVLDDAEVAEVAGLRVAGTGDPLFRPSKEVADERDSNRAALAEAGASVARAVEASELPVHVALVHEPRMAEPLLGVVPLVLDGHVHERRHRVQDGTLELTQGSSGGAGLRTLDGEAPRPLEMSVLHLSRINGSLLAVDEITVAGIGSRAVTVQRLDPSTYRETAEDDEQDEAEPEQRE